MKSGSDKELSVSVLEITKALEIEINTLQKQLDTLNKTVLQVRDLVQLRRLTSLLGNHEYVFSLLPYLKRAPDSGRIIHADRRYRCAWSELSEIEYEISKHNDAVVQTTLSPVSFLRYRRCADKLAKRRTHRLEAYKNAKRELIEAIEIAIKCQVGELDNNAKTARAVQHFNTSHYRYAAVLVSYIHSELNFRTRLLDRICRLPDSLELSVSDKNLEIAIRDPNLHHQISLFLNESGS